MNLQCAVIGIGSNSVRMLIAHMEGKRAKTLLRDRTGTRLFGGLTAEGILNRKSMEDTLLAVCQMVNKAKNMGIPTIHIFATSAVRDAGNQQEFSNMILEKTGVELDICSGASEAALSFLGATEGGYSGVIDIGGGSTEIVLGEGSRVDAGVSLQMGAVRLFRMLAINGQADLAAVIKKATEILAEGIEPIALAGLPSTWIGVGGTFTTLAAIVKHIPWTDKTYMHGTVLELSKVRETAIMLSDMPMEKRLQLPGLQPHRADIVVHGICILLACMQYLKISAITVSEYGNLDGYIKMKYLA